MSLTGICDSHVQDAPTIDRVIPDFLYFLSTDKIVGHNIHFDLRFLAFNAERFNCSIDNEAIDTLSLARRKLKGLKNHKLETVIDYFNIPLPDQHRAFNDCLATGFLYIELLNHKKQRTNKFSCQDKSETLELGVIP